jgi:hypothetical protein
MLTVNASPFPAIYDILIKWWYHGGCSFEGGLGVLFIYDFKNRVREYCES